MTTPEDLTKELVNRFNSHGMTDNDVRIHNSEKVSVYLNAKSHRGKMTERTNGVIQTARKNGWVVQNIGFDNQRILFEKND